MDDLFFFDADCQIGSGPNTGIGPTVRELLDEMDEYGIDRALVRHINAPMLGALESNRELAEMLKADESGRLTGVWSILPSQCRELPEPDEFFRQMKENHIGALTLHPYDHRYVPCRLTLGKIMDAARERRIPILVNAFSGQWRDLYRFVADFPQNILILCDAYGKWGYDRQVRPMLETYSGFYYGMTGYWVPEGIRDLADTYGAERFLYSSGYPRYIQGSGMLQLKYSGLGENKIAQIAGENLAGLLKGVQL